MGIGKKIKAARLNAGFTRKEVAEQAGITEAGLYKIEKEERGPLFETVEKISAILNISLDSLR